MRREGVYRARWTSGVLPADVRDADRLLAGAATRILKDDGRTTVGAVTVGGTPLVLKRFREGGLIRFVETLLLGSRAMRARRGAARLAAAGFPVPELLAVLERPRGGIALCSCAVTRHVAGVPLDELWRGRRGAARRALTLAFADYLRGLHDAGLYPQDLRGANVLVTTETPPVFVLVDLDRVRRYRRLSWHRRLKNLVQVHRSVGRGAPVREGLRFLDRYLRSPGRAERRRVAAAVVRLGLRKDAEYARRRGDGSPALVRTGSSGAR